MKKSFSVPWKNQIIRVIRTVLFYFFRFVFFSFLIYFIYLRIFYLFPNGLILFQYPIITLYAVILVSIAGILLSKEFVSSQNKLLSVLAKNSILLIVLFLLSSLT